MATGMTIKLLTLNLSFMLQPCVRVATMVVSEIKDRLSPNMAPPTTMATMKGVFMPVCTAIPTATGVSATIVPTEVPMESEMKQAAINIPASKRLSGSTDKARLTVASTAPTAFAVWANAPARIKIHTMSMILLLAAPLQNRSIRLWSFPPEEMATATTEETRNATVIGIL